MVNAEQYAPEVPKLIANNLEGVCIQFARDISEHGDYEFSTCPLHGIYSNAEKLEKWLKQEAQDDGY